MHWHLEIAKGKCYQMYLEHSLLCYPITIVHLGNRDTCIIIARDSIRNLTQRKLVTRIQVDARRVNKPGKGVVKHECVYSPRSCQGP